MTETERIIAQGIVPPSFLLPEEKCGFLVTEKRKKIWAVELDILKKLDEVCRKHHLTYWGDGGTLLGAVRHGGFIPWDDDIDIIMPREDYNRLAQLGPEEFTDPYFLQTPHTDPHYGYSFMKIRNSHTTCIPRVFAKAGFNHGIHIDVFPLDHLRLDTFEDDKRAITECIMKCSSYMKRNAVEMLNERQMANFRAYWTDRPAEEYDKIQQIASNPAYAGSEHVANATVTSLKSSAQIWRAEWFDRTVMHPFETIDIPMPADIGPRLQAQYGDYMQLPPVEQRGQWHPDVTWDPDKPYTEYV